jgi:purine-binding chemotaxis protein CheW
VKRNPPNQNGERLSFDWDAAYRRLSSAAEDDRPPSPDEMQRVLKGRATALALPLQDADERPQIELVVFELDGERYAVNSLDVSAVREAGPLTPIPGMSNFIAGILNHRGTVLTILDFRPLLKISVRAASRDVRAVIVEAGGVRFGLVADAIVGLSRMPAADIAAAGRTDKDLRNSILLGTTHESILVLSAERLARDARLVIDDAASPELGKQGE